MNGWKVTAIIFIILFVLETAFVIWGVTLALNEEKKTNECFYNFCAEYPEAYFQDNICTCYNYDLLGELRVAKTEYMK